MINGAKIIAFTKKEYDFKIVALIGFLTSLLLLVFCYTYFGSFFESNDDPRYVLAMKGIATPLPFDNFVSFYKFTAALYIALYKYRPDVGWYGLSMFLLLWGALFNSYIALYLVAKNRINYYLILVMFIAFYFLIFFQNVYCINFARPVLLVTTSFIMLLTVLYLHSETLSKNKWILIFPVITYVFAHLTRLDAGYLGFSFGFAFSILFLFKQKSILPFFLKFIVPVVCFILLIEVEKTFSEKNRNQKNDCYEKSELIRHLIDYKNGAEYVPKNIRDKIAYDAVMLTYYFGDGKIITLDFLKRLTYESSLLKSGRKKKFDDEFGVFTKSLENENSPAKIINFGLLAILLLWLLMSVGKNYLTFIKYVLFQLFFLSIIVGLSYYLKLPTRIFTPLLGMLTLGNLIFTISNFRFDKKQFYYILFVPCFFIFFGIPAYAKSNNELISYYKEYGRINQMMVDDINNSFSNTIFIPTNGRCWEMHAATDPVKEINFKNKNCYVYLSIDLSLTPETKDQLINKFGTNDHSQLFKKISEMNNVVFISDDFYNNFLRAYYHYFYNQDYYFEKVNRNPPPFYLNTGLNYYRLKK